MKTEIKTIFKPALCRIKTNEANGLITSAQVDSYIDDVKIHIRAYITTRPNAKVVATYEGDAEDSHIEILEGWAEDVRSILANQSAWKISARVNDLQTPEQRSLSGDK